MKPDARTENLGLEPFPRKIRRFLSSDAGYTLLINGSAGTGKTLLSVSGLAMLERRSDVFYVSTRVSRDAVYRTCFDRHDSLDKSCILDLSQDPFVFHSDVDVPFDRPNMESFLEWVRAVGDASNQLTIVFDSWELIYEYLSTDHDDPDSIETVTNRMTALARQEDISMLLISEQTDEPSLGYIVDGVVTAHVTEDDRGRTQRSLCFEKLRGVHVENRRQPFTLADGRFRSIVGVTLSDVFASETDSTWDRRDNHRQKFSTGIRDLDTILGGGYNRGSVVHLNLGENLPRDAWCLMTLPLIRNFLAHGLFVGVTPPPESSPGLLHNDLTAVLPPEVFESLCYVVDTYTGPGSRDRHDTTPGEESGDTPDDTPTEPQIEQPLQTPTVATGQIEYEPYIRYFDGLRDQEGGPMLHTVCTDSTRSSFRDRLGDLANYVALHNDLAFLITRSRTTRPSRVMSVADVQFELRRMGEALVVYGENPLTPVLAVGIDRTRSPPELKLTEMV
jgi:RecA-superfamily ATPases implicated in signal transduction